VFVPPDDGSFPPLMIPKCCGALIFLGTIILWPGERKLASAGAEWSWPFHR
jgi:hypothetical protein